MRTIQSMRLIFSNGIQNSTIYRMKNFHAKIPLDTEKKTKKRSVEHGALFFVVILSLE